MSETPKTSDPVGEHVLPDERECCGTFPRTPHRATCAKYRGKFKPSGEAPCPTVTANDLIGHVFYVPSCLVDDDGLDDEDRPY